MRCSPLFFAAMALPLTEACYRVHGAIQQFTDKSTFTTTYTPSIYLEKDGATVCDGHSGQGSNPYQAGFVPGAIPTNTSFSGPWGASDCSSKSIQVDLFGVNGQALIKDNRTEFWLNPESLAWSQPATAQNLAGNLITVVSVWNFDSGNVQC